MILPQPALNLQFIVTYDILIVENENREIVSLLSFFFLCNDNSYSYNIPTNDQERMSIIYTFLSFVLSKLINAQEDQYE